MELWDVYDRDRKLTGRTMERGSEFEAEAYHLVVHVCIFNSKGEMLIQKRQPWKEGWPNMWDITVGGSAVSGEGSREAAQRETLEEIGYKIDLSTERPFFTINFENGFDDYYLLHRDLEAEGLKLQYEEVQAVKWASKEEIKELIKAGEFIDYWFIENLFEIRNNREAIRS